MTDDEKLRRALGGEFVGDVRTLAPILCAEIRRLRGESGRGGPPRDPLAEALARALDDAVDAVACDRHNDGAQLLGNTQASDLDWLARVLFEASRLGAGDVRTVPWLLGPEEWAVVGLTPQALLGDGPRRFDQLDEAGREAWRKLGRIVLHVIPAFAERVGQRWMAQAKMAQAAWKVVREQSLNGGG
jgi:hypothetical protein